MGENSAISWCDHTFNGWIGCSKVSPACDHCYAERDNKRRGWVPGWGAGVPRRRTKTWGEPLKWDRKAAESGRPLKVFCASLADVFDNEVPDDWRADLFDLIRATRNLRWMLLTKRIGNAPKMLPRDWTSAGKLTPQYSHVGLMATLATQEEWDRDIAKLLMVPAAWHGVSAEPLLGPIDMRSIGKADGLHWMITGGESGAGFRYTDRQWVHDIMVQCEQVDVAFHHKQWGGIRPKENGCAIDGREHKAFPEALAA